MPPRPEKPAPGAASPEEPPPHSPRPPRPPATPRPPRPPRPPATPSGLGLIGVGAIFASMVLSGFLLGYWTDIWLDTRPVFMLIFAGLGLIGGLLKVYKLLT